MDSLRGLVRNVQISPQARVYGFSYLWAESYKVHLLNFDLLVPTCYWISRVLKYLNYFLAYFQVIATELYRNVLLAMLVVFLVTFLIIANPLTSFLVFLCVAFTVVSIIKFNIKVQKVLKRQAIFLQSLRVRRATTFVIIECQAWRVVFPNITLFFSWREDCRSCH
jgi:Ca2+/Na+ antiporter